MRSLMRIWIGLLLFFLPTSVWADAPSAAPVIEMEFSYGFQNTLKHNTCVPVRINLKASAEVAGILRVKVPIQSNGNLYSSIYMSNVDGMSNKEQCHVWEKEIVLQAGKEMEYVFYIDLPEYEPYVEVLLLEDGKVKAVKSAVCHYEAKNTLLVGLIGYENEELRELEQVYLGEDIFIKGVSLSHDDLYDNIFAYEHIDLLLVKDAVASNEIQNLPNSTQQALEAWQKMGGMYFRDYNSSVTSAFMILMESDSYKEDFQDVIHRVRQVDDADAENVLNHVPVKAKTSTSNYIFIIVLYLLAVGPGLYLFLKNKKDPRWLMGTVTILAVSFVVLVFWVSGKGEAHSSVIAYTALYEQQEDLLHQQIEFSVQAYQMQNFEIEFDKKYQLDVKNTALTGSELVNEQMAEQLTFSETDGRTSVLLENIPACQDNRFLLRQVTDLVDETGNAQGIQFEVNIDDEGMDIYWENSTEYTLEYAVLVLKRRAVPLCKIQAGSKGSLRNQKIYSYTESGMYVLLDGELRFSDYEFGKYEIEHMGNQILKELAKAQNSEAFVIGIIQNPQDAFAYNPGFEVRGTSLMKINVEINSEDTEWYHCLNMETYGTSYKGEYDAASQTMHGREAIVDYSVNGMRNFESLQFFHVNYNNRQAYPPFYGKIYLFNWKSGAFVELADWKAELSRFQLESYISNLGVVRVYYVLDERLPNAERQTALPCIRALLKR